MSKIKIRPVERGDIEDLWKYTFEDKSKEEVAKLVGKDLKKYKNVERVRLVAEVGGKVVARSRFKVKKKGLKRHLGRGYGMYVNKNYRGRGIAGKILNYAEKWMKEQGAEKFVFTVRADSVAEKVYRRREGYKEFGRLPKGSLKDGEYHDVVYMYKDL